MGAFEQPVNDSGTPGTVMGVKRLLEIEILWDDEQSDILERELDKEAQRAPGGH